MSRNAFPDECQADEIVSLIATLHATEQRLELLTRGEIDTVRDRAGGTLVLRSAQLQVHQNILARQAAVLDALPVNMALLDADGVITSVNEAWRNFAMANGMNDPSWGVGSSYLDVCDQASGRDSRPAASVAAGIRAVLHGETRAYSIEYPCHSTVQQRWFLLTAAPLSQGAAGIVVMHLDVTARRKAQEILLESEQRFSAAFQFAPIGVALVSPDASRWLRANRVLCALLGYSEEELQQMTVKEVSHPDDAESSQSQVLRAAGDGVRSFEIEKRYLHRTGQVIEALVSISLIHDQQGEPLYFVAHILDMTARKLAERQLLASNVKFQQFADNITDAFWIRSADMKEVQYISPAFERIWGRPVDSLYSSPQLWSSYILAEDREQVGSGFSAITGSAPSVDLEYRIVRPDGEIRWVHVRGSQVRDDHGTLINIIGIVTDVTERRRVAAELQTERARLVLAQHVAKVGDWETDLVTWDVAWSEETRRIFETDSQFPVSHPRFMEMVHPEDRDELQSAFEASFEKTGPSSCEHRILFPDGRVKFVEERWQIDFDASGQPVRALGTCQDISERKHSETALRASQRRLRDLIDGLGPSMFVGLLTPEGVILEVNRSPLDATGTDSGEIVGHHFADAEWWSETPEVRQALRDAIVRSARGEPGRFDVRARGITGNFIDLDFSLQPLHDEGGAVVFLVASAIVITARKQAEAALRRSQKLEAVGQLAAGVAHEFNNILQTLMSMATIMRIRAVSPEILRIAGEMETQLRRGAKVTQQLLAASRHQELTQAHVDLREHVATTRDLLRRLIPENIEIAVELCEGDASVEADAGQLQQVLLNLAINARDAMPDGGLLTLRVLCADGEVSLEVEDTGTGFDEHAREHLFEPFFTTKEVGKGTGLGLAVVYGIVKQHGGRIEVRSEPGSGSLFRVILPRTSSVADVVQKVEEPAPPAVSGRILVVEDEEGVREGLTTLLTMVGYEVTGVANGEEAIALPDAPAPDVLLSDLSLPGIGGLALATLLSTRWPDLKVTLMTGYLEAPTRDTARDRGWDVLLKPFDIESLTEHLAATLGHGAHGDSAGLGD